MELLVCFLLDLQHPSNWQKQFNQFLSFLYHSSKWEDIAKNTTDPRHWVFENFVEFFKGDQRKSWSNFVLVLFGKGREICITSMTSPNRVKWNCFCWFANSRRGCVNSTNSTRRWTDVQGKAMIGLVFDKIKNYFNHIFFITIIIIPRKNIIFFWSCLLHFQHPRINDESFFYAKAGMGCNSCTEQSIESFH